MSEPQKALEASEAVPRTSSQRSLIDDQFKTKFINNLRKEARWQRLSSAPIPILLPFSQTELQPILNMLIEECDRYLFLLILEKCTVESNSISSLVGEANYPIIERLSVNGEEDILFGFYSVVDAAREGAQKHFHDAQGEQLRAQLREALGSVSS